MGLLLEDRSKELLNRIGITVPKFITATTASEACKKSLELVYPVSLKVLAIGKDGTVNRLVRHASNPQELQAIAALTLSRDIANSHMERIMVQEKPDIHKSLGLKLSIDYISQEYLIQVTCSDCEDSDRIGTVTERFSPVAGLDDRMAKRIWSKAGMRGPKLAQICGITTSLFNLFKNIDAYFIELYPLGFSSQGIIIAEHFTISIDDNSMFRHPELEDLVEVGVERFGRSLTKLEEQILQLDREWHNRGTIHFVELEGGDIGFMCGSGGGSYMLFDSLLKFGGRPANYSEFRGNPNRNKISGLTKAILSKKGVRGLFIAQNITSNTQLDLVAQAVIEAMKEHAIDFSRFPVVVRQCGVNEEKAREIFSQVGIEYYGDEITLVEAAERMVKKMNEAYPGYCEEGYLKWQY